MSRVEYFGIVSIKVQGILQLTSLWKGWKGEGSLKLFGYQNVLA